MKKFINKIGLIHAGTISLSNESSFLVHYSAEHSGWDLAFLIIMWDLSIDFFFWWVVLVMAGLVGVNTIWIWESYIVRVRERWKGTLLGLYFALSNLLVAFIILLIYVLSWFQLGVSNGWVWGGHNCYDLSVSHGLSISLTIWL